MSVSLKDLQDGLILIIFFLIKLSTLEPDFYKNLYEIFIEVLDMEPYKTFLVPFDSIKLIIFIRNDPVKIKKK